MPEPDHAPEVANTHPSVPSNDGSVQTFRRATAYPIETSRSPSRSTN